MKTLNRQGPEIRNVNYVVEQKVQKLKQKISPTKKMHSTKDKLESYGYRP